MIKWASNHRLHVRPNIRWVQWRWSSRHLVLHLQVRWTATSFHLQLRQWWDRKGHHLQIHLHQSVRQVGQRWNRFAPKRNGHSSSFGVQRTHNLCLLCYQGVESSVTQVANPTLLAWTTKWSSLVTVYSTTCLIGSSATNGAPDGVSPDMLSSDVTQTSAESPTRLVILLWLKWQDTLCCCISWK